jgi:transposase
MVLATLGIDLAVRASHVATLADEQGNVVWSRHRFRNRREELVALVARVGDVDGLTVVMEPTRNAWVPVAAYFRAVGAKVVLIAPEQSADLRRYYKKHTKNDRLDSVLLSRVPLLHPEGLKPLSDLGPADALKRAVRRRSRFVASRLAAKQRIDAMLDLLGPAYAEVFGTRCNKTTLAVLERYADPITLRRLGLARLTAFVKRTSHGHWNASHAAEILAAADAAIALWADGGLDFGELAWDLASEIRTVRNIDMEIDRLEERIAELYAVADPKHIAASAPGVGATLAAGIVGRLGDVTRFENLAGIRSFSGIVPQVAQSGQHQTRPGITKQGDPGLRRDLWFAANVARTQDPQLAAKYYRLVVDRQLHHNSAICHIATTLLTRIATCLRNNTPYVVRDIDGRELDRLEAAAIITARYTIPAKACRRSRVPNEVSESTKQESTKSRSKSTRSTPTYALDTA